VEENDVAKVAEEVAEVDFETTEPELAFVLELPSERLSMLMPDNQEEEEEEWVLFFVECADMGDDLVKMYEVEV